MLEVNTKRLSPPWQQRLNRFAQRSQGLDPELIERSKLLFGLKVGIEIPKCSSSLDSLRPRTVHIEGVGDATNLLHSQEAQQKGEEALRSLLPQGDNLPTANELHNWVCSKTMGLTRTFEGYFVDRFYSSAIDQKGLEMIERAINEMEEAKTSYIPMWMSRGDDVSTPLFFGRIFHRKEEEVGYKIALANNPYSLDTPDSRQDHKNWNGRLERLGSPPEFDSSIKNWCTGSFCEKWREWNKKVRPETFKQLREALEKDKAIREKDPTAPLFHLTYSSFMEKKFFDMLLQKGITTLASVVFGAFSIYMVYSYGHIPAHYMVAKL